MENNRRTFDRYIRCSGIIVARFGKGLGIENLKVLGGWRLGRCEGFAALRGPGGHGDLQISDVLEVWCFLKY